MRNDTKTRTNYGIASNTMKISDVPKIEELVPAQAAPSLQDDAEAAMSEVDFGDESDAAAEALSRQVRRTSFRTFPNTEERETTFSNR